jgi:Leucine-rich repeat (LRR) protein
LTGLESLYLSGNQITDLGPLAFYTNLHGLLLSANQITDISALVENLGLAKDDLVYIDENPLTCDSATLADISTLEGRGVSVIHDCP